MQISYIADQPDLANGLIPGLLDHWRELVPEQTWQTRADRFREHMNRDRLPIGWIAHRDGIAAGTAALRAVDLDGREDLGPWLGGVYVHPDFRRQGIASALCEVVADKARVLGFQRLFLFTPDQQSLYRRLGWRLFEKTTWRGRPAEIMLRELGIPSTSGVIQPLCPSATA